MVISCLRTDQETAVIERSAVTFNSHARTGPVTDWSCRQRRLATTITYSQLCIAMYIRIYMHSGLCKASYVYDLHPRPCTSKFCLLRWPLELICKPCVFFAASYRRDLSLAHLPRVFSLAAYARRIICCNSRHWWLQCASGPAVMPTVRHIPIRGILRNHIGGHIGRAVAPSGLHLQASVTCACLRRRTPT